jgi:perosamine synthetase
MIPVSAPYLGDEELGYVADCVRSGWISSLGEFVSRFEEKFSAYCGCRHGVAVSNGTTALHLALVALGIGPGDEVIVPTLTFIATANAVHYTGATPVFVDSDPRTWSMDPEDVLSRITPRTRAIIPVHLYGFPVDMDPILSAAKERGIDVIEDAAEAHGARCRGRVVGSLGRMGCFSFYGNKIVTTGEGGMVVTNDASLAERLRSLRDHGMSKDRRYWHPEVGFNYRLTNLQAAVGVAQVEKIGKILDRKRKIARLYDELLSGVGGITLPPKTSWAEEVCWLYSILVEPPFRLDRDSLMAALALRGIETRPFFWPLHEQPPYRSTDPFPVAESLARKGMNLPSGAGLAEKDVVAVAEAIREMTSS